ncbi:hypothetical protein F4823DRAFT_609756 [Ustulina deusta]|nr:hypothetical protein F4823DRAFT_609756 [Ustulina deusta]
MIRVHDEVVGFAGPKEIGHIRSSTARLQERTFLSSSRILHFDHLIPSFHHPYSCAVLHFLPSLGLICQPFLANSCSIEVTIILTPHTLPSHSTKMRFTLSLIAACAAVAQAGVFSQQTYDDISISGGVAGNAQNEALAVFSALDQNDLANVDEDDLDFLNSVNQIANDAETDAFNPAIDDASGDEADALQRGKIKNKVLKLTAAVLKLQAQAAQGEDVQDKLDEEQTKLNNNIQQDEDEAGNESTFLSFDATTD